MSNPTYETALVHGKSRQEEHGELDRCVVGIRAWMLEVDQFGIPRFGEAATRLRPLRDWLDRQFQYKHRIVAADAGSSDDSSLITDDSRQPPLDDPQVLDRLDDLIRRLNRTEPCFRSWQEAMDDVECCLDEFQRYEESAAENIASL